MQTRNKSCRTSLKSLVSPERRPIRNEPPRHDHTDPRDHRRTRHPAVARCRHRIQRREDRRNPPADRGGKRTAVQGRRRCPALRTGRPGFVRSEPGNGILILRRKPGSRLFVAGRIPAAETGVLFRADGGLFADKARLTGKGPPRRTARRQGQAHSVRAVRELCPQAGQDRGADAGLHGRREGRHLRAEG